LRLAGPDLNDATVDAMAALGDALEVTAAAGGPAKVVLVGQGCNSAATTIAARAPTLPKENITTLSRVAEARAKASVAAALNERVDSIDFQITGSDVHNVIIWGGDSDLLTPDMSVALVVGNGSIDGEGTARGLAQVLRNPDFVKDGEKTRDLLGKLKPEETLGWVRNRDSLLQTKRQGYEPHMLLAKGIADHLQAWFAGGLPSSYFNSVGVWSTGNGYAAPEGLFFSFPTMVVDGNCDIVPGITISPTMRQEIDTIGIEAKGKADRVLEMLGLETTPAFDPPPVVFEVEKKEGDEDGGDGGY
jgi:malate dehydrogenase